MPNLKDVERRIKSVKSTRQITSTMQMVAAAKVPRATRLLQESMPYSLGIRKMLAAVSAGEIEADIKLMQEHEAIKTTLLVVIVSDKGLAGGFNSNIMREAQHIIDENKSNGIQTKVIACGKKAHVYFDFRNVKTEKEYIGSSDNPQFSCAEEIVNYAIEQFVSGKIDKFIVVRNKCKNSMEQTVEIDQLLPIETDKLSVKPEIPDELVDDNQNQYCDEIVFEPDAASVLKNIIPTYLRTMMFNYLLDSACGEQVARRVAMQAATDSANEMVDTLTRIYNSVRQGAITTEINEIVGGAEALQDD